MRVYPFVIQLYPHYIISGKGISYGKKISNKLVDLSIAFAVEILEASSVNTDSPTGLSILDQVISCNK